MDQACFSEDSSAEFGLIVFWPSPTGGLWDADLSEMLDRLEDETGAFVTHAGPGCSAPTLVDAVSAARYMGCSKVLVVAPEDVPIPASEREAAAGLGVELAVTATPFWSAGELARIYRSAGQKTARAA